MQPHIPDNAMVHMVREGEHKQFNSLRASGTQCSLENVNLRGVDLRLFNLDGVSLRGAYLRNADLRGLDLRSCNLEGASLKDAKISGTFFPAAIAATEIQLSMTHGSRLRHTL